MPEDKAELQPAKAVQPLVVPVARGEHQLQGELAMLPATKPTAGAVEQVLRAVVFLDSVLQAAQVAAVAAAAGGAAVAVFLVLPQVRAVGGRISLR
jgi:hypothetical protein